MRSIIAGKWKFVGDLVTTVKKVESEGSMKILYETTKTLAGNYDKPERPVKDK